MHGTGIDDNHRRLKYEWQTTTKACGSRSASIVLPHYEVLQVDNSGYRSQRKSHHRRLNRSRGISIAGNRHSSLQRMVLSGARRGKHAAVFSDLLMIVMAKLHIGEHGGTVG